MTINRFEIKGGKKLKGTVRISGSKNAALKLIPASLLIDDTVNLGNLPEVEDIKRISELITFLGPKIEKIAPHSYKIVASNFNKCELDRKITQSIRASIMLTAPLLARKGKVKFPHPGGCVIGERPIDLFLAGFKSFGGKIKITDSNYEVSIPKLIGTKFVFKNISVTGTETMIMLGVLAKGKTELINSACEPEVVALANFLKKCGAKIKGEGTHHIKIEGVKHLKGADFRNIPDRIETGSFAILAAATKSNIKITNCEPSHLEILWSIFKEIGVNADFDKQSVEIKPSNYKASDIKTREYPGFPTDLQGPWISLMSQAKGKSLVHETIYEGRLLWTEDLKRMGANIIMLDPHRVIITGPTKLRSREVESPDIRAGMAFIIAALIAKGKTIINNIYQIDRGYEKIEEKLKLLGADIKRT